MIKLKDELLKEYLIIKEVLDKKKTIADSCGASSLTVSSTEKDSVDSFITKLCSELNLKKGEFVLDVKCGIIFTRDERIITHKLHNHHTGEIY